MDAWRQLKQDLLKLKQMRYLYKLTSDFDATSELYKLLNKQIQDMEAEFVNKTPPGKEEETSSIISC
jgi:hypothetical protein